MVSLQFANDEVSTRVLPSVTNSKRDFESWPGFSRMSFVRLALKSSPEAGVASFGVCFVMRYADSRTCATFSP